MKRIITLFNVVLLFIPATFAQSFAFFQGETQLANNAEITVTKAVTTPIPGELEVPAEISLKNITDEDLGAKMRQTIISHTGSGDELINWCFNVCSNVPLTTSVLERISDKIPANSFEENFHTNLIVYPGEYATVTARYDLIPLNTFEMISITVHFVYNENSNVRMDDIASDSKINISSEGNRIKFNYANNQPNTELVVYNMTGQKLANHQLTSGSNQYSLQLSPGIYVCALRNDRNITTTQKFIVK